MKINNLEQQHYISILRSTLHNISPFSLLCDIRLHDTTLQVHSNAYTIDNSGRSEENVNILNLEAFNSGFYGSEKEMFTEETFEMTGKEMVWQGKRWCGRGRGWLYHSVSTKEELNTTTLVHLAVLLTGERRSSELYDFSTCIYFTYNRIVHRKIENGLHTLWLLILI